MVAAGEGGAVSRNPEAEPEPAQSRTSGPAGCWPVVAAGEGGAVSGILKRSRSRPRAGCGLTLAGAAGSTCRPQARSRESRLRGRWVGPSKNHAPAASPGALGPATACSLAAAAALLLFAAPAHAMIMQADDQFTCVVTGGDVSRVHGGASRHRAAAHRAPTAGGSNAVACASRASAQGYRVYVSLQYDNAWRPAEVAAYFRRTLPQYAPFAWAVSVGNEQDLSRALGAVGSVVVCSSVAAAELPPEQRGEDYRAVWNAVEPVVARVAPRAIRVFGETSPFGFRLPRGRLPAPAARAAPRRSPSTATTSSNGGLSIVPQVAAWAASERLPLWCSEMSASSRRSPHPWLKHRLAGALECAGGRAGGPLAQPADGQLLPLAGDRRPVEVAGRRLRGRTGLTSRAMAESRLSPGAEAVAQHARPGRSSSASGRG